MANEEHLKILKQGVEVWNQWRAENSGIDPDLTRADLSDTNLNGANLRRVSLGLANLTRTSLVNADLSSADLPWAIFKGTLLDCTNLSKTNIDNTSFDDCDLSGATGLEAVTHDGPCTIGIDTLNKSKGKIPEIFLRGCGLSDWQIENARLFKAELSNEQITDIQYKVHSLRISQAIQIKPLFISYSHSDKAFVDHIEKHLNQKGVRFWRDIHHATAGRLEQQIDRAIRLHPVVLLILSANSVESDWVRHEARLARKLEQETKSDVLCPIALDDAWKSCDWPERLREQIEESNILDFLQWQDQAQFDRMFARLIEGLGIFYK